MQEGIVVEFSGWLKLEPETARFQHSETEDIITGVDYIKLSEDERDAYVLSSVIDGLRDCYDNEWTDIQVILPEDDTEQQRRDEKNGLYCEFVDDCN